MSAAQLPNPSAPPTVVTLLTANGNKLAGDIEEWIRLGAGVQQMREVRYKADDANALNRTAALYALVRLDGEIGKALENVGFPESVLEQMLSIEKTPPPADVRDVAVHPELARALTAYVAKVPASRTIRLPDVALAIMRDARDHLGFLGQRLRTRGVNVQTAVADLERMVGGDPVVIDPPPPTPPRPTPAPPTVPRPTAPPAAVADDEPSATMPMSDTAAVYLACHAAIAERHPDEPGRAIWGAFVLVASQDPERLTVAGIVVDVVLREAGIVDGPDRIVHALEAVGVTDGDELLLAQPEPVDGSANALLVPAGQVRDHVEPDQPIRLRHLLAAALDSGQAPRDASTRRRDIDAVRSAFLSLMVADAPRDTARRWRAHFDEIADARWLAGVDTHGSPRDLADLDVDAIDDTTPLRDELRVVDDVMTLCDVLAARDAARPISVGLFGRWGTGKSYFMALMRRRIDALKLKALEPRADGSESPYCAEIVQIPFNAWHYMDANLWATLAVHLFEGIAEFDRTEGETGNRDEVLHALYQRELEMSPVDQKIACVLRNDRLDDAAARMGLQKGRHQVLGLLEELSKTSGYVRAAGKVVLHPSRWTAAMRRSVLVVVVLIALLSGVALAVTLRAGPGWSVLAWLPAVLTAISVAGRWVDGIVRGLHEVNDLAAASGLEPVDVTADRIAKDEEIEKLKAELEEIDQANGMRDFVRERALSTEYSRYFGVISVLRHDLEGLVARQRRVAPHRRIILYIDDLDRCSPTRVVEVLQAVHLLLAFPLFVAVVGVDPRWLLRSLERHYRQVLSASGDRPETGTLDQALTETTPQDYLEKIFQIPFSLARMKPADFGRLVASLAAAPTTVVPTAVVPTAVIADGGERRAGDGDPDPISEVPTRARAEPPRSEGVKTANGSGVPVTSTVEPGPAEGADTPSLEPGDRLATVSDDTRQLRMTDEEVTALGMVGPLIDTPRSAKRLINLYRLIRASLSDAEVEPFVTEGRYRPLVVLLAAQVGFPRLASVLLADLAADPLSPSFGYFLDRVATKPMRFGLPPGTATSTDWRSFVAALQEVLDAVDERDRALSDFDVWIPQLQRYSFEGALGELPTDAESAPSAEREGAAAPAAI